MDDGRRDSLVPPDFNARQRQSGPMRLMLLGLAISVAAYFARGRLGPAPRVADAAVVAPPQPSSPISVRTVAPQLVPAPIATAVDAFGSIGGPDESAVAPTPKRDEPTPLRLQSIMIGPRRRVCMINDRPCVVGDSIDGAVLQSIGRASVIVRRAGRDVVLALPKTHS